VTPSAVAFEVTCPSCQTRFPVDPAKVPEAGVPAICSTCLRVFRVSLPGELGLPEEHDPPPAGEEPAAAPPRHRFGRRDPNERARHLARVLVSDIIAYQPDQYRTSLENGTLEEDFREEIAKSWKEYLDQVGREMAEGTTHFDEALKEILGTEGKPL
jgi:predicted Zn finger-like uncharacterized protein